MKLNSRQSKTLAAIFKNPVQSNIPWRSVESLFKSLGADITQGNGSRIRVYLNGERAVFHEPHPENVTDKGAVISVRDFLLNAGISEEGNVKK